jgi:hypothetical protein
MLPVWVEVLAQHDARKQYRHRRSIGVKQLAWTLFILILASCMVHATEIPEHTLVTLDDKEWQGPFQLMAEGCPDDGPCLRADVTGGQSLQSRLLPVKAGEFYEASVWVRTENVIRHPSSRYNRGAVLFAQWRGHAREHVSGGTFPTGLFGTNEWTQITVPFTYRIPENVGYVEILLGIEGSGTAWFRDLVVNKITEWDGYELLVPADDQVISSALPTFLWRSPASFSRYEVEISSSPDFPEEQTTILHASGTTAQPTQPLSPGTWYWRVRGFASNNRIGPPSKTSAFRVPLTVPPQIMPGWGHSSEARPHLEVSIFPPGAAQQMTASISGVPAELIILEKGKAIFAPTADLPPGIHEVEIKAHGFGDQVTTTRDILVTKSPGSHVSMRRDGLLLVDGQPFFPIGAYRDPSDSLTDFSGLKEAGFNMAHAYVFEEQWTSPSMANAYLDAAWQNNLRVFLGLNREQVKGNLVLATKRWAAELMDRPALLTWYLYDEPEIRDVSPDTIRQHAAAVRAADPFHPTSVVISRPVAYELYAPSADILWVDPYPVPTRALTLVEENVQLARTAAPDQPVWAVIQAFDNEVWRDKQLQQEARQGLRAPSRPTPEEIRNMAFQALAAGAKGIVFYWTPNTAYHIQKHAPVTWQGVVDTVQTLNRLMPFLVAEETEADALRVVQPLRSWSRNVDGQRVVVLINTAEDTITARVDLNQFAASRIYDDSDGSPITLEEGQLRTEFAPYEVKVYRLDPVQ